MDKWHHWTIFFFPFQIPFSIFHAGMEIFYISILTLIPETILLRAKNNHNIYCSKYMSEWIENEINFLWAEICLGGVEMSRKLKINEFNKIHTQIKKMARKSMVQFVPLWKRRWFDAEAFHSMENNIRPWRTRKPSHQPDLNAVLKKMKSLTSVSVVFSSMQGHVWRNPTSFSSRHTL